MVFKPKEYCLKNYPCEIKDSTYVKIDTVKLWDTLSIFYPYQDISFDTSNVLPPDVVFHHETTKGNLTASVTIKDGKLSYKCEADSLKDYIAFQKELIKIKESRIKTIPEYCNKKHVRTYHTAAVLFFWLVLTLAVLRFFLRYFTGK